VIFYQLVDNKIDLWELVDEPKDDLDKRKSNEFGQSLVYTC